MSDANRQSVERCKYRHDWTINPELGAERNIVCRNCRKQPNAKELKRAEAILHLRTILPKGSTVYTILKHVSRSGMTRGIDCYALSVETRKGQEDGHEYQKQVAEPIWITPYVGHAIESPQPIDYWRKSLGLKVGGCGMDMGFHVVNSLSYALYDNGYAIKHQWL